MDKSVIVAIFQQLAEKRIIFLFDDLDATISSAIIGQLLLLDALNNEEITLYINCSGGDVEAGLFPIYDIIQSLKSPIRTIVIGQAYSSAAILLAAGTKGRRFAYPHAQVMIHNISTDLTGTAESIDRDTKLLKKLNQVMMETLVKHTGQPMRKIKKYCSDEKTFNAKEALKAGLIDDIIIPATGVSLP